MDDSVPRRRLSMQRWFCIEPLNTLHVCALAVAPHTVYHPVFSKTTSSHPRLPGHLVFLEAFSVPLSPHQYPWGFSFIAQNSISCLRPMKITVQHQSPCLSFLSSHSPSQSVPLYDLSSDVTCRCSRQLGYVLEGKVRTLTDHLRRVLWFLCVCAYVLACWIVDPTVSRWGRGSFCL